MILEHEPVSAQPYQPATQPPSPAHPRRPNWRGLVLALLLLPAAGAWFLIERLHLFNFETDPPQMTIEISDWHMPLGSQILLWQGPHIANASAPGYHPAQVEFKAAPDAPRTVRIRLDPLPGRLRVTTVPEAEGEIWVAGESAGKIGEVLDGLEPGPHDIEVRAEGFEGHRQEVQIEGRNQLLDVEVALKEIAKPALLAIATDPESADILVDGEWRGQSPQKLTLTPGETVEIAVLSPGFTPSRKTLKLETGTQTHSVTLVPRTGTVELWPTPTNATVRIDGKAETRRQLQLAQRPHTIEISAPNHLSQKHIVVPHPDAPQKLIATLQSRAQAEQNTRMEFERKLDLVFVPFRPRESFGITTTRRRIPVRLTRPFAIMDKEVTNGLYERYQALHDSGQVAGHKLNRPSQPVVNVTWMDAAQFANWMSEQAGIAPFYRMQEGRVTGFDASATGYRLPSEAEWVWLTRGEGRFAWGDDTTPPDRFGNLADASAGDVVQPVLAEYNDGHPVSADVGSYTPSPRGLYDLPGNVAEWMHDVFLDKLRISLKAEPERANPLGEASGRFYVIRGFSWRDAKRKELSLVNRRYDQKARDDVGFRLAHYLNVP